MKTGFVFGKFMPLHNGHLALIEFGLKQCDQLQVILCYTNKEPIDFAVRKQWLNEALTSYNNVTLIEFEYAETELPNTSVSSRFVSEKWGAAFKTLLPDVDIVFTSEPYGDYVAEFMGIEHQLFDENRKTMPVSASQIREKPFRYWQYIPMHVRNSFVKKVCILGTESTGKTTLTGLLAKEFNTSFVPEMARDIVEHTEQCTLEDLKKIAELHAQTINDKQKVANKLLFVDTDLLITKSYSQFLFDKELVVDPAIENANKFDLYLYLEDDCPYVQDGTRLSLEERTRLNAHHKNYLIKKGINFTTIDGNWETRFKSSREIVNSTFMSLM